MRKFLLSVFMTMSAVVSGYALEQGELVYTPQGRFQITSANVNANNAFQTMDGWTVVSATEKTLADNFNINANGYADGLNSVVSLDATAGEGMYFKFEPSDAGATYIVSYKMKGAALDNIRTRVPSDGRKTSSNLVRIAGHETADFANVEDEVIVNTAEELTEDWQTFNYAIVGDGTPRTWFISFASMATNIEIADLQIAPALQFADLRQRDAMLEKLNAYKNCYNWDATLLDDLGYNEVIANLQAAGDESGQAELDELLTMAQKILDKFIKANMDDYLASNNYNYLGLGTTKMQKVSNFGDWTATTTGRAFWSIDDYPELGHYAGGNAWNYNNVDSPMGVYMQKTLDPGSYVFSIQGKAAVREETSSSSWTINEALDVAYGMAYIIRLNGDESVDTIASVMRNLEPVNFTSFVVPVKITEGGTYEFGFKAYCKEAYKQLRNGSVTYIRNASIWGKNENIYNQKQLTYEANVRSEIATAREQLNTAQSYLADKNYFWNKDFLQYYVDDILPIVEAYEAMSQDEIIATYDEDVYQNTIYYEEGLLQYTVYQMAVSPMSSAIRDFLSANEVLTSLQTEIDNAEATMALRIYGAATGKNYLSNAIANAKDVLAQMKKDDYSEENEDLVNNAISELNDAVEYFKTTIPESAIETLVDIDFATPAEENTEANYWSISGAVNSIILSNFGDDSAAYTFAQGFYDNGEKQLADVLRVGNGEAIVEIPEEQQVDGTNILKIEFDYYFGNLSQKNAGFYLYSNDGNVDSTIAAFYFSRYNNTAVENTFGLNFDPSYIPGIGNSQNADLAICAEKNRTHFEIILDYGEKTMYCSTSANGKSQISEKVNFNGAKVAKFAVRSNYNYANRRCWFDNLKIEKYLVQEPIDNPTTPTDPVLEQGEFVYTPQGRFQITGANVNANNAFQNFAGWIVVSASTEKILDDNFVINADGYAEGLNSVASLDATEGEGMYFKFEPSDAGATYVVSYKMKGATAVSTRAITTEVSTNLVKVEGNSDNIFGGDNDVLVCNRGEELTEDWQTFNYAIVGDGTPRTYYISFTGMATNIEIADVQIAPAMQFADLRQRDAMVEKMEAYKNCYAWSNVVLEDLGYTESLDVLKGLGDEAGQAELDELLGTCQEIIDEFVKANMDDYLAGNTTNYLGIKETSGNLQKQSYIGDWTVFPGGRGFWTKGDYPDLGHFQYGNKWCMGSPESPMGVSMQKNLIAGSYVFAIEGRAAVREPRSQSWTIDEGMKPAYGVAYIVKVNGEETDTIVSVVKDLQPIQYTPFFVPAKITEDGIYEFGFKAFCKDTHKELKQGSVVYVKDASIWSKNGSVYNQKQLAYEENVRTQITAARENLTTAEGYLANADYFWGKANLQACIDTIAPIIAEFEALDQDAIIATFDEDVYQNTIYYEEGLLQYTVYQMVVSPMSSAIRDFLSANEVLTSLQAAIDNAEATLALRIYCAATGKNELSTAIANANSILAQMKKVDYSEKNENFVNIAISELNEAVETFKATVPSSAITTLADIDFEQDAVYDYETESYFISGAVGAMEFSHFSTVAPEGEDAPFQQGYWDYGEQKWKGYLRVGNGTGIVNFNPIADGKEDMGTNILKISCDFYIQGLSNRSVGFFLRNEVDSTLAALYRNYYYGTDTENTFGADMSVVWAKSGGSYDNASPADAEAPTATVIQKTNFEVVMDYGTQTMYCTITSPNGTTTSEPVAFNGIPAKFVLQSDYDNRYAQRRCWFDNLKIERYSTELEIVQGRMGDVNHDDEIDVTDVVLIIDDILVKNPANYDASLADVNNDNYIDVTDVVMVIDAILGKIELSRGAEPIDRSAYTAFQMDLTIPAGYVVESVSLTEIAKNSHSLAYAMLPDGRCRVVVCSMNNEALPGAWDEVICLNLRGQGDAQVNIDRAVFVTIDGERHELMMNPTSIAELSTFNSPLGPTGRFLQKELSTRYDLQGRKVEKNAKGILLENGKKAVKK